MASSSNPASKPLASGGSITGVVSADLSTDAVDHKTNSVPAQTDSKAAPKPPKNWIEAAWKPIMTYTEAVAKGTEKFAAAVKNGVQDAELTFPCSMCDKWDRVHNSFLDWNWCSSCFSFGQCPYASSEKHQKAKLALGKKDADLACVKEDATHFVWNVSHGKYGCVLCDGKRAYLECVKCSKLRGDGVVKNGAFMCSGCDEWEKKPSWEKRYDPRWGMQGNGYDDGVF